MKSTERDSNTQRETKRAKETERDQETQRERNNKEIKKHKERVRLRVTTKLIHGHRNIWTHTLHWLTLLFYNAMRRRVKFNHSGLRCCTRCGLGVV
jgi:hypothetical protein